MDDATSPPTGLQFLLQTVEKIIAPYGDSPRLVLLQKQEWSIQLFRFIAAWFTLRMAVEWLCSGQMGLYRSGKQNPGASFIGGVALELDRIKSFSTRRAIGSSR